MNAAKSAAWFAVVIGLSVVAAGVRFRNAAVGFVEGLADASDGPDLPGDLDDWDTPQAPFTMLHGTEQVAARVGDVLTKGNINALPCGSVVKRDYALGALLTYDRHGFTMRSALNEKPIVHHRDKVLRWGDVVIVSLGGAA